MEITTCEQYVLNRVKELDEEVERLKVELLKKEKEVTDLQEIVTTYDEAFREYGEKDIFNSGVGIELNVSERYDGFEKTYFKFLNDRNGEWLKVNDYRDKKETETETTEGEQ